jgi:hypothetical protein
MGNSSEGNTIGQENCTGFEQGYIVCYDDAVNGYRTKVRSRAQKLRDSGYSYAMIHNALGIPKGTLSHWFRDRAFLPNKEVLRRIQYGPLAAAAASHNRKVREIQELKAQGEREIGNVGFRDLWFLGLGLYIGEGSKAYETVRIINSDPDVIRLAIRWFRDVCKLDLSNITIAVHLYPDNDFRKSIEFWRRVTGLPLSNFRKTQVDTRLKKSPLKRGKLPYGTAHITIVSKGNPEKGVRLYRRLNGWISGTLSQI